MSHPAHNAREGIRLLEAAVVEVLVHGECLGPAAISKRAGIHREIGSSRHDGITEGSSTSCTRPALWSPAHSTADSGLASQPFRLKPGCSHHDGGPPIQLAAGCADPPQWREERDP